MSVLTAQRGEMCYCPGCSHGMVLEYLGQAIDRLGRKLSDICIVSDIGCIGTADRYFACHTFHGLHGRSITYAEGIKRARPDLLVIVLIGDGGCGIGTAHLVHVARRNADIKVVVCNNFNFGMTGGQHSPTTPCEGVTSTTPTGAIDYPFDICATVAANGATYVARHGAFDPEAVDCLQSALITQGFALVDMWELCTAYYVPGNQLNRGSLNQLSQRMNMPFGVLHQSTVPSPPLSVIADAGKAQPRPATEAQAAPSPVNVHKLPWASRIEISVAGSAGQRIRSAVGVIGELAVAGGLFAAQQDDYPITVRKGFSVSNLIISPAPILYTGVDNPDLILILSHDGLERLRGRLVHLKPSCLVAVNSDYSLPPMAARMMSMDLSNFEKRAGKASAALAALAYVLAQADYFQTDKWFAVARAILSGPYRQANLSALQAGFDPADQTHPASLATHSGERPCSA